MLIAKKAFRQSPFNHFITSPFSECFFKTSRISLWGNSHKGAFWPPVSSCFLGTALLIAQALWICRRMDMTCHCAHCLRPPRQTSPITPALFKIINCWGEIIEVFVYQVAGSSPGICDWKPGLFLYMHKTGFWQQQFFQTSRFSLAGSL